MPTDDEKPPDPKEPEHDPTDPGDIEVRTERDGVEAEAELVVEEKAAARHEADDARR